MEKITTYLNFNGQCEDAFKFYEHVLGGKIEGMMKYEGSPMAQQMPPEWRTKVLHARITIANNALMASDAPPDRYQQPAGFSVALSVDEPREAERIFKALAENGTVRMPLQETFWALRFGDVVDRFGTPWMINCEKPDPAAS